MADPSRRAALGTLAAELGHELQGPLNLFRLATDRAARGEPLDAEDVELLREELERLSRLSARLRALATTPLARRSCTPGDVIVAACHGTDPVTLAGLHEMADHSVVLDGDPLLLGLALRELIDNAQAAKAKEVGLRFSSAEPAGFCVWDDGPGFALDFPSALAWGATSKPGAAGIGLTLALRVARAHGFRLEHTRAGSQTQLWLLIPARELRGDPSKLRQ
jgi:signal transduction histidine kinase